MVEIVVPEPPVVPRRQAGAQWLRLLPIGAVLAGAATMFVLGRTGVLDSGGTALGVLPVIMAVSALASMGLAGSRHADLDRDRDDYLDRLAELGAELSRHAEDQRAQLLRCHPDPASLATAPAGRHWRRRRGDPEFGRVRIGCGMVAALHQPVRAERAASPRDPGSPPDPIAESALQGFLRSYAELPDLPVTVDLLAPTATVAAAEPDRARAVARAIICQLACSHPPDAVRIAAVLTEDTRRYWEWLKWLPHNHHPRYAEDGGASPMFYRDPAGAQAAAGPDRHLLIVIDGVEAAAPAVDAVTVLTLQTCPDGEVTVNGRPAAGADRVDLADAELIARRLAGYPADRAIERGTGWCDLMGIDATGSSVPQQWWESARGLRIPLGVDEHGEPIELDINEAARGGMGPHGLCVGATGSGKSELLRTVALGMIAGHPPEDLNLVLVDFKGGATFLDLERARHVSAVITNLGEEAHLVDRMQDALAGEIHRRQQLLRSAGNLAGVHDYRRARAADPTLPPLPTLFVIIDEFSELLTQHPEFADVFLAIGRLGRSLGIHLLLASQRLEESRLRGLESHLSYRICLKTLSAGESRMVVGIPDAYELPATPGWAYLKVAADPPVRFHTAHVSGPVDCGALPASTRPRQPVIFAAPWCTHAPEPAEEHGPTLLDVVLDGVAGHGAPAHRVWLDPLRQSPTLTEVLDRFGGADLCVPIGLNDRVFEQRRAPLTVDLSGPAGHVAVVGAPQSGKSATLRTLALALAATHDPRRIQLYCLDFGGGGLGPLRELPHVGCVAGRRDVDLVHRTVAELTALVQRRDAVFTRHGVESMAQYRRRRAAGELPDDPHGDVFLMVDGWAALRQEYEGLETAITTLAAQGLSLGVHVVLAATRWADLRPALKDQLGTRIELRLADPLDSEIDRRAARAVPADRPGWGLAADGTPMTVALPRLDDAVLAQAHPGVRAPVIAVLPTRIDLADFTGGDAAHPVLGVAEDGVDTVTVDFTEHTHLLVLGERGCGKTALLRSLARQLDGQYRVVPVDPRGGLTDLPGMFDALRADLVAGAAGPVVVLVDDYDVLPTLGGGPLAPLLEVLPQARDLGLHLVIARRSAGAGRALYEPVLAAVREGEALGVQMSAGADEGPLLTAGRPRRLPPGRAVLVSRQEGERLVQLAWSPP